MMDFIQWLFSEGSFVWLMISCILYVVLFFTFLFIIGDESMQRIPTISFLGLFSSMGAVGIGIFILIINIVNYI